MKYTLKPCNIASMLGVEPEQGQSFECMYMQENDIQCRPSNSSVNAYSTAHYESLPREVREAIYTYFNTCFSIPNDYIRPGQTKRGAWVDAQTPFSVTA